MVRQALVDQLDHDPQFAWRGHNVTRIENLSDICFALALSMLVAGSGTPSTFQDLSGFLFSIIPVALGFSVFLGIWHAHFTFFRRFGLADKRTIALNAILIFVVLYMAYPLRFAFDSLFAFILMQFDVREPMLKLGIRTFRDSGIVIGYFAVAYAASHALFAMMYQNAIRKRGPLNLNPEELALSKQECFARIGLTVLSLMVAGAALLTPLYGFAGALLFFSFLPYVLANRIYPIPAKAQT